MNNYEMWQQRATWPDAVATPVCDLCKNPLFDASGRIMRDHRYCAQCKVVHCNDCWDIIKHSWSPKVGCCPVHTDTEVDGITFPKCEHIQEPQLTQDQTAQIDGRMHRRPTYSASVLICPQEGGYYVYVPSLSGCLSQGDTVEEAVANIKEAFTGMIESYVEDEVDIPWQVAPPVHLEGTFETRIFISI